MVKIADLKIIEDALTKAQEVAKAVKIRIMKFAAMALEKIGGESCKANAKKQKKNLDGEGSCPKNAAGV